MEKELSLLFFGISDDHNTTQGLIEDFVIDSDLKKLICSDTTLKDDQLLNLLTIGVAVVPVYHKDTDIYNKRRDEFINTVNSFPEYKYYPNEQTPLVAGGFAALGNPASFHNPLVRDIRKDTYNKLTSLFKRLLNLHPDKKFDKVEALFDRMMYRHKNQQPTSEAWHSDVMRSDQVGAEDVIFGGWINLDNEDQYFSCIPGSHLGLKISDFNKTNEFPLIEPYLIKKKYMKDVIKTIMDNISSKKLKITIPPGHCILFPQHILHEIVANKATRTMMRLFTGWRLTKSELSMYIQKGEDILEKLIDTQAVIQLPGGMIPPLYGLNHARFYKHKQFKLIPGQASMNIQEWSVKYFKDEVPQEHGMVKRYLPSLKDMNLPMYAPYTSEEKKMYFPHTL